LSDVLLDDQLSQLITDLYPNLIYPLLADLIRLTAYLYANMATLI